MSIDIKSIIRDLKTRIDGGAYPDEVVDSYINTASYEEQQAILDQIGDIDLSEPKPDLKAGWTRVRAQLAYIALYKAVTQGQLAREALAHSQFANYTEDL